MFIRRATSRDAESVLDLMTAADVPFEITSFRALVRVWEAENGAARGARPPRSEQQPLLHAGDALGAGGAAVAVRRRAVVAEGRMH
jgi:hypothetical protein